MRHHFEKIRLFVVKSFATLVAVTLHKINHLLRFFAALFNSDTLDKIATDYSNWYNLGIIGSLLNFEGTIRRKKVSLSVASQETVDDLMITKLTHHNLGTMEVEAYVHSRLSLMSGIDHSNVRLTHIDSDESKLLIPIITYES